MAYYFLLFLTCAAVVSIHGYGQTYREYGDSYDKYLDVRREGDTFQRFKELGAVLVGNGLRYGDYYYGIRCDKAKLFRHLNACYDRFYGLKYCLFRLSTEGLVGRRHIHQWYGRGYGLGVKFVKRGIIYHHTYYKRLVKRSVFIEYLTKCEETYHSAQICVQKMVKKHVLTTTHIQRKDVTITRIGDKIHHKSTASSHASHHVQVNGKTVYQSHAHASAHAEAAGKHAHAHAHAFTIVNGIFTMNGIKYKLNCATEKFNHYWDLCQRYFKDSKRCIALLNSRHLFYKYVPKESLQSARVSQVGTTVHLPQTNGVKHATSGNNGKSYAHAHVNAFSITDGILKYNGKEYELNCKNKDLYQAWDKCIGQYHDKDKCIISMNEDNLLSEI